MIPGEILREIFGSYILLTKLHGIFHDIFILFWYDFSPINQNWVCLLFSVSRQVLTKCQLMPTEDGTTVQLRYFSFNLLLVSLLWCNIFYWWLINDWQIHVLHCFFIKNLKYIFIFWPIWAFFSKFGYPDWLFELKSLKNALFITFDIYFVYKISFLEPFLHFLPKWIDR